jgi:hypothetical protein
MGHACPCPPGGQNIHTCYIYIYIYVYVYIYTVYIGSEHVPLGGQTTTNTSNNTHTNNTTNTNNTTHTNKTLEVNMAHVDPRQAAIACTWSCRREWCDRWPGANLHVCMVVWICACMSLYIYICVCVCVCMHVCMYVCMYVYIYIYICIYIYTI